MVKLHSLTDADSIRVNVAASDWREAIRASGLLLTSSGAATKAYTEEMIANVEKNGPYIVVAPGFAFAHSRTSEAVKRTGMSWVRLRQPVEFGSKANDPVTLVAALAAQDSTAHVDAMQQMAKLLGDQGTRRRLDEAPTPEAFLDILREVGAPAAAGSRSGAPASSSKKATAKTRDKILTVCGNGVGTSLFLKNTLDQVLDTWGWGRFIATEATDTISAKGKAKEADLILTSGEIAKALGDVGVPVRVIQNFSSTREIDAALRDSYDI